jgi:Holliday junction resolvase
VTNSRRKGKRCELALAAKLRSLGFPTARRGQQFSGSPDSPDVVAIKGLHIECKGVEKLNIWKAMAQAASDCGKPEECGHLEDAVPVVCFKRNRSVWYLALPLDRIFEFIEAVNEALEKADTGELETKEET